MVTFSHYSAFIVTTRFTEGESQDQVKVSGNIKTWDGI
jgi:hypothetical protein